MPVSFPRPEEDVGTKLLLSRLDNQDALIHADAQLLLRLLVEKITYPDLANKNIASSYIVGLFKDRQLVSGTAGFAAEHEQSVAAIRTSPRHQENGM